MSDPKYTLVEYVAADCFAVSNAAKDSFVAEFAVGLRLRADCQADGIRLGSVTQASHDAGTGRTLVTVLLDSGAVLTANLTWVLHGCVDPDALCSHTHAGPAQGGALPAYVKADCSIPFVGGHIQAQGAYTGFKFTETGAAANAAKSIYQVDNAQVSLLLVNDAETIFNPIWTADRNGATPTYFTLSPPVICSGGITTDTINDQDISGGIMTKAMGLSGGECRLTLSGSNLLLSRCNGKRLIIDDVVQTIPAAGVTLAATGTVALTLYYIYAFMASGTMAMEASTTAYVADPRNGVLVKSGDTTRTLVGMARTIAGPAWVDSLTQRLVVSSYNRRPLPMMSILGADTSFTSATDIILGTLKLEFLSWDDYAVSISLRAPASKSYATYTEVTAAAYIDGSFSNCYMYAGIPAVTVDAWYPLAVSCPVPVSRGYHYIQIGGRTSTPTASTKFSWASFINALPWG